MRVTRCWPSLVPLIYHVITTAEDFWSNCNGGMDFMQQFEGVPQLRIGQWLIEYINSTTKEKIQSAFEFTTGSLQIPLRRKISIQCISLSPLPEGRKPRSSLCFNELKICQDYEQEEKEQFIADLEVSFSQLRTTGLF